MWLGGTSLGLVLRVCNLQVASWNSSLQSSHPWVVSSHRPGLCNQWCVAEMWASHLQGRLWKVEPFLSRACRHCLWDYVLGEASSFTMSTYRLVLRPPHSHEGTWNRIQWPYLYLDAMETWAKCNPMKYHEPEPSDELPWSWSETMTGNKYLLYANFHGNS